RQPSLDDSHSGKVQVLNRDVAERYRSDSYLSPRYADGVRRKSYATLLAHESGISEEVVSFLDTLGYPTAVGACRNGILLESTGEPLLFRMTTSNVVWPQCRVLPTA